jgi:hypothetical protein
MKIPVQPEDNQTIALRILAALRGYTQRQAWVTEDVGSLVDVLDTWDSQVDALELMVGEQRQTISNQLKRIEDLIAENEELRATSGLKGVMTYLKAKSGLA